MARENMPTRYDPAAAERRWYATWVERGYFHVEPGEGHPYCIVLPPPNVTGALHVGHALNHTLQDVLIRRTRMQGLATLWVPGTDHAGIATQVVVERELAKEGVSRRDIGREAFLERVWQWKEQYGDRIVEQMKALGNSCDWDRLRFTMDEGLSRAVRVAFVRLYDQGLIYRGERIINWCPTDGTTLSDSELEFDEVDGELVTFRYPLSDGDGHVDVATTRVETMLGDTGVAVHPDDERYRALVGRTVRHPFTGRDLPIVADPAVEPGFGTGAVKVTPAHDPTDFEIAERTGLPRVNIFAADATLNDSVPEEFRGLDRYEARKVVAERLRDLGLIVAEERPYRHPVGHCYRCGTEVEPWLSGEQWFVRVRPLAEPAKQAVLDSRIEFFPERWRGPYLDWLDRVRDWNISRQLWWGHRIPVWYCDNGHEFAALEDPDACRECGSANIEQDPDVLDTWFSSQLWPFSTLGWPDETPDLEFFYPTTALVTGYEIMFLWVARMVMSGMHLMGDVPFHHVVINGLVRDAIGRKMSKSLGNVIDPLDMIDRYGADALRFALMRLATAAQDIPLSEDAVEAGRNFANKIWNGARLVLSHHEGGAPSLPPAEELSLAERWLLSRHQVCVAEVDAALAEYRFADAAVALQRFFWSEYCDWALELEKGRLYGPERETAAAVLAWVLERTMRLLHPIMPFVTEEVWQRLGGGDRESIVIAPWPEPHPEHSDPDAEDAFGTIEALVSDTRQTRAALPQAVPLALSIDSAHRDLVEPLREQVERLTGSTVAFVDGLEVGWRAEVSADTDLDPVRGRLRKRLADIEAQISRSEVKLANDAFVERAPQDVVDAERRKTQDLRDQAERVREQLELLAP